MNDRDQIAAEDTATETPIVDENPNRASRVDDVPPEHPRDRRAGKDTRSIIKNAIKTVSEAEAAKSPAKSAVAAAKPRAEDGKFTPSQNKGAEDRGQQASPAPAKNPETPKPGETAPPAAPQAQAAVAAPATAPKEVAAIWDKLPQEAQTVFAKREADMLKGVEQIKSRLKPFEDAFAPVMGQLQQLGKTPAEATTQLLNWQAALANPRTQAEAFRALAKAHNFDIATLAAPASGVANPNPSSTDPTLAIRPLIDPVLNKVSALENEFQRRDRERVQNDIAIFSKDKPHFERVKQFMGHLMANGLAQGENPKEIFDDAYARACRADPEVFALIQQEEQAKRAAETKAQAEAAAKKAAEEAEAARRRQAEEVAKARKAAVGPRSGSPTGMAIAAKPGGRSVGESIRNAIKEHSAAV